MARYLMIDFGSTFTKLVAVDGEREDILATAMRPTTVTTDIRTGYRAALADLEQKLGGPVAFDRIVACSSAAGGLKMAAIGLVEELTVEAAKRVCLGERFTSGRIHFCQASPHPHFLRPLAGEHEGERGHVRSVSCRGGSGVVPGSGLRSPAAPSPR